MAEHVEYLATIFVIIREKKLYVKSANCEFWFEKIAFLKYIVHKDSISMDPAKVKAMIN